ncbi:MAG: hypothetical protein R2932_28450 [Caldilineaceae bacterium]
MAAFPCVCRDVGSLLGAARYFQHTATPDVAYFNNLADAFLHGRLYLVNPPSTDDLTFYAGQWYVPFPPLPALLMVPWVALYGLADVNTVFFGALFGALNVTLLFLLLRTLPDSTGSHFPLVIYFG